MSQLPETSVLWGGVLVSGHSEKSQTNRELDSFLETPFDFKTIKSKIDKIVIIHSDNDPFVPLHNAETLSRALNGELMMIPGGGHFTGREGWRTFPQCLEALHKIMGKAL